MSSIYNNQNVIGIDCGDNNPNSPICYPDPDPLNPLTVGYTVEGVGLGISCSSATTHAAVACTGSWTSLGCYDKFGNGVGVALMNNNFGQFFPHQVCYGDLSINTQNMAGTPSVQRTANIVLLPYVEATSTATSTMPTCGVASTSPCYSRFPWETPTLQDWNFSIAVFAFLISFIFLGTLFGFFRRKK